MTKKICSKCKTEKELSDFRRDKSKKDGRQSYCKLCARDHFKSRYSESYGESYNKRNVERRNRHAEMLQEYKHDKSCLCCDESENICLDFHHVDPTSKSFTVSGQSMGRNWEQIEQEISKCVLLCSNCHRKFHAGLIDLPT